MNPVEVSEGDSPIILGMPHGGTYLPTEIESRLNPCGRAMADTDWHIKTLYHGLLPSATIVRATFSRYLVDANRDPSGTSLYPGMKTTGTCPTTNFDGAPIYKDAQQPDTGETESRIAAYHAPYHRALSEQITRAQSKHGVAVLYDCHSIRSNIPNLFEGTLPVFNIGTKDGETCGPGIEAAAADICGAADGYDTIVNGRFKGGWTTRHYGRPTGGVHAIQMELAQRAYMDEAPPWNYQTDWAGPLRQHLENLLHRIERLALDGNL